MLDCFFKFLHLIKDGLKPTIFRFSSHHEASFILDLISPYDLLKFCISQQCFNFKQTHIGKDVIHLAAKDSQGAELILVHSPCYPQIAAYVLHHPDF